MTDIKKELDDIRKRVSEAEKRKAVAEARRDQAKADLKTALQKAVDDYGARTLPDLEAKVAELRATRDQKMAALREATSGL